MAFMHTTEKRLRRNGWLLGLWLACGPALPVAAQALEATSEPAPAPSALSSPDAKPETLEERAARLERELNESRAKAAGLEQDLALARQELAKSKTPAKAKPPVEVKPKKDWSLDLAVGGTLTSGNTDSYMATVDLRAVRETKADKLLTSFKAAVGDTEGKATARRALGEIQYNRSITEHFYWLINSSGLYDEVAGLDYRYTFSPGLGYYLAKTEDFKLSAEAGPAYVLEKLANEQPESQFRARLAERLEYKVNEHVKVFQNFEFLPDLLNFEDYLLNAEAGIDTKITKVFGIRCSAQNRYNNEPAEGRQKNDLTLTTSLVYTY